MEVRKKEGSILLFYLRNEIIIVIKVSFFVHYQIQKFFGCRAQDFIVGVSLTFGIGPRILRNALSNLVLGFTMGLN